MTSPIDVNEAYRKVIRTRSYVEVWAKVHRFSHLSNYLLKPRDRDLLRAAVPDPDLQAIFLEYFVAGELACNICVSLLSSVDRLRREHLFLQRFLHQSDCSELASYAEIENLISAINFKEIQDIYETLLQKLNLARSSFARRARLLRRAKVASGVTLMVAGVVVAGAAVAFAPHAAIACLVAGGPALVSSITAVIRRKKVILGSGYLVRLLAQTEAASRGAYIMNRDIETLSRIVARLHEEVEHRKRVVILFLRCRERWVLAEAVGGHFAGLEELEEHVYSCLVTIKRTWALLAKEMMASASPASS